jgi:hypothetical protein
MAAAISEAHKRPYRHPKYKTAYRVRNWPLCGEKTQPSEVLHHGLLLAVEPPGEADQQELPRSQNEIHGSPNAAEEQERAASGMAAGVSTAREPSLIDIEMLRSYGHFGFD